MAENTAYTLTRYDGDVNPNEVAGKIVFPATAIVAADYIELDIGFAPRYIHFLNITDRVGGEFFAGMAADSCLKTIADGTRTLEVTGGNHGITLTARGFRVSQNATLALILASKTIHFRAVQ